MELIETRSTYEAELAQKWFQFDQQWLADSKAILAQTSGAPPLPPHTTPVVQPMEPKTCMETGSSQSILRDCAQARVVLLHMTSCAVAAIRVNAGTFTGEMFVDFFPSYPQVKPPIKLQTDVALSKQSWSSVYTQLRVFIGSDLVLIWDWPEEQHPDRVDHWPTRLQDCTVIPVRNHLRQSYPQARVVSDQDTVLEVCERIGLPTGSSHGKWLQPCFWMLRLLQYGVWSNTERTAGKTRCLPIHFYDSAPNTTAEDFEDVNEVELEAAAAHTTKVGLRSFISKCRTLLQPTITTNTSTAKKIQSKTSLLKSKPIAKGKSGPRKKRIRQLL